MSAIYTYTWDDFTEDCRAIVKWARGFDFNGVYGIPRCGVAPALYLSHTLFIPLFMDSRSVAPKTLVVDANTLSGGTLQRYAAFAKTAVLVHNPHSFTRPNFFARESDAFPIFPWEADSTVEALARKATA